MSARKTLLGARALWAALALVLIQQIMVAGGTYLMGDLAAEFPRRGLPPVQLGLLIACLVLSGSVVHYFVTWFTTRAQKSVLRSYFLTYAGANYNHPDHWRYTEEKSRRHQIMAREGQDTLTSLLYFVVDCAATGANIIFNTAAVFLVAGDSLALAILAAGFLGLLLVHAADARITAAADREMSAQNDLNGFVNDSWDNIILGNREFYRRWLARFDRLFALTERTALANVRARDAVVALAAFLTNSIVVGVVAAQAWSHRDQAGVVLALLIMLPRSMQIVMHFQVIQSYWAQWTHLKQRLRVTEQTCAPLATADIDVFIKPGAIRIRAADGDLTPFQLTRALEEVPAGRFTIGGDNGSGKSTLLVKLKRSFGEDSVYIPAQHALELGESTASLSSGEKALRALREAETCDARILLLDEWDANLSEDNRRLVSRRLDQMALSRLIVEVRQRAEA
jgi:ABC-type bacteriocin/lantibiotic exporter with double-glycine peptidase domain